MQEAPPEAVPASEEQDDFFLQPAEVCCLPGAQSMRGAISPSRAPHAGRSDSGPASCVRVAQRRRGASSPTSSQKAEGAAVIRQAAAAPGCSSTSASSAAGRRASRQGPSRARSKAATGCQAGSNRPAVKKAACSQAAAEGTGASASCPGCCAQAEGRLAAGARRVCEASSTGTRPQARRSDQRASAEGCSQGSSQDACRGGQETQEVREATNRARVVQGCIPAARAELLSPALAMRAQASVLF